MSDPTENNNNDNIASLSDTKTPDATQTPPPAKTKSFAESFFEETTQTPPPPVESKTTETTQTPPPPVEDKKPNSKEENFANLRKKVEEAEKKTEAALRLAEERQQKFEETQKEIERLAFEKSEKFTKSFAKPVVEARHTLEEFAKEYEVESSVVDKALALKGKARIEYIEDNFTSHIVSTEFNSLLKDYEAKNQKKIQALEDAKATKLSLEQEERLEEIRQTEIANKNFDRTKNLVAEKLSFFRQTDDPEHNAAVEKRVQEARRLAMGEATEMEQLSMPFFAAIAKDMTETNKDLIKRLEETQKELESYKQVTQRYSGSLPKKTGSGDITNTTKIKSFKEAVLE